MASGSGTVSITLSSSLRDAGSEARRPKNGTSSMIESAVRLSDSPVTQLGLDTDSSSGDCSLCCISRSYRLRLIATPWSTILIPLLLKIARDATTACCSPISVTVWVKCLRSSFESFMLTGSRRVEQ
jgi:hypothetical protein